MFYFTVVNKKILKNLMYLADIVIRITSSGIWLSTNIFLFSEVCCINSDGWSSMSGFKEEHIDGCFFRATYSGKGGAYDLTAQFSLLMRRNDRAESPIRLCTSPSVLKYTSEYLSF